MLQSTHLNKTSMAYTLYILNDTMQLHVKSLFVIIKYYINGQMMMSLGLHKPSVEF